MNSRDRVAEFTIIERCPGYDVVNNPLRRTIAELMPVGVTRRAGGAQQVVRNAALSATNGSSTFLSSELVCTAIRNVNVGCRRRLRIKRCSRGLARKDSPFPMLTPVFIR